MMKSRPLTKKDICKKFSLGDFDAVSVESVLSAKELLHEDMADLFDEFANDKNRGLLSKIFIKIKNKINYDFNIWSEE